jgi:DNA-directed RNA polymerase specialized sigma24 family protein
MDREHTSARRTLAVDFEQDAPGSTFREDRRGDGSDPSSALAPKGLEAVEDSRVTDAERRRRGERITAEVRERLSRRMGRYVPEKHLADDIVQDTLRRALDRADFPADDAPMFPWLLRVSDVARKQLLRQVERDRARHDSKPRLDEDLPAAPHDDASHPDLFAARADLLEEVTADDTGKRRTVRMINDVVNGGKSIAAVAQENNMSEAAAQKEMWRFKNWIRELGGPRVALLLLGACLAYVLARQFGDDHTARDDGRTIPPVEAPSPEPAPSSTPAVDPRAIHDAAARLAAEGVQACDDRKWGECVEAISKAIEIEPSLRSDPEIDQALQDGIKGIESKGPGDVPKRPKRHKPATH